MPRTYAYNAPQVDASIEEALRAIGEELEAARIPMLAGVVLGGGYGRGEGGVIDGRLSNDLDFYVVTCEGASAADIAAISGMLEPISKKWTARLGVDVDFCPPKTPWRLKHDEKRVMIQELVHGYVDVAGNKGEELFKHIERREPSAFPWDEAARLLANRGAGLLLAQEKTRSANFTARNINKAVLGAGDARLIARHAYEWAAKDRARALGDALYSKALEWKFRPRSEPVCSWEEARTAWMDALAEISAAPEAARRSLYQAVRWIVRRRTLGNLATLGQEPVARIAAAMRKPLAAAAPFPPALKRDWEIFN